MATEEQYMRRALELAVLATGRTTPNPVVGAVIVKDGVVVGEGYHHRAGTPHAEVHALEQAGEEARGATIYVTLEPCCHYGKTGPCSQALIAAGIKKAVVATLDPNPLVAGRGVKELQAAGIEVKTGLLEEEAREINQPFLKRIQTGLPYVAMKTAMTMDGKMAAVSGDSRWVTGEEARRQVHRLRNQFDVVMVGAGTVLQDNPHLNVRLITGDVRDPVRAVVDGELIIPLTSQLVVTANEQRTLVFTSSQSSPAKAEQLAARGVEVVRVEGGANALNLTRVLHTLADRGLSSVLVEGGGELNWSLIKAGLVDYWYAFIAPWIIGGRGVSPVGGDGFTLMSEAVPFYMKSCSHWGNDLLIEGWVGQKKRW